MISRNPFRVQVTEHFNDDWNFVSLFGSGALDVFDINDMWTKIQIICSARGGGKTSLLRIFSPKSLHEVFKMRNDTNVKILYNKLKELDVFSSSGKIRVLGIYLSMYGNYSIINQLNFNSQKKNKLFYSLLICRVIIATLRSVCELLKIESLNSLQDITINNPLNPNIPNFIKLPCTGKELYDWAVDTEQKISNIIENDDKNLPFNNGDLSILNIINSQNIFYKNKPITERTLLMLDDVDKLVSDQRIDLMNKLCNYRIPMGIWIAERLEALRNNELLSLVGTQNREYKVPTVLEKYWRINPKRFEMLVSDISDKRMNLQQTNNIGIFKNNLQSDLFDNWDEKFSEAIDNESKKLIIKYGHEMKYKNWFDRCKNLNITKQKIAGEWKELEILIERDKNKNQQVLFDNIKLSNEQFENKINSKEKEIGQYYIRMNYKIPYYFGFSNLAKLSSSNIMQFLELAGVLFDEMIASTYSDEPILINPDRQEKLLRKKVFGKWEEIKQSIPDRDHVIPFLNNVAKFCYIETNLPNSPYGGVTGISISTNDLNRLRDLEFLKTNSKYKTLSNVLSICFAHNLLEPHLDIRQGVKGTTYLVMYLNRVICFKFKLPLSYGRWRNHNLDTLSNYIFKFETKRKHLTNLKQYELLINEEG